ncbi:MAG TPA: hypothetical protein VJH03_04500 [Blastocatellia bacterium]|nr:hypothetical protein [Blastocatellia bacterium]
MIPIETGESSTPRPHDDSVAVRVDDHPSKSPALRKRGYGIGGGMEKPRGSGSVNDTERLKGSIGPLPHSGYFGAGESARPFKAGEARFGAEISLYGFQYGEITSGLDEG